MKRIIIFIFYMFLVGSIFNICAQKNDNQMKPFSDVITSNAESKIGFIITHLINDRLYFEISDSILNKDLLFINHQKVSGFENGSFIRLVKSKNKILVTLPEIDSKVGNTIPLIKNKFKIQITPISFPILSTNKSNYIIDVTNLFINTPKGLHSGGANVIIPQTTFINKVKAFLETIEVNITSTIVSENGPITSNIDFSLFLLPEPMIPRLYDHRMGFFSEDIESLGMNKPMKASITRWKLEKKYKNKKLSEPVTPITLYLDPTTPEKWRPYIKAGIYEWLPAFESAGFKNAIEVKEAPIDNDEWSMNSMRYSVVRWVNRSEYRGHEGEGKGGVSKIVDIRTGQILKGDILIGRMSALMERYFVGNSPLDKRAQQYPFPDDLMGELIQSLTAHETGHVFGIMDGNYGEFSYPFDKMRDRRWLKKMGHTPSIMSYDRHNYIVQPEDSINPSLLIQKVGPTDIYNIRWAYTHIKKALAPDEESPFLEEIVREQDTIPWYRYNMMSNFGPDTTNEVLVTDDPIRATELSIKNLKKVLNLIPEFTKDQSGNVLNKRLYLKTLELWVDQMKSVVSLVGGFTIHYKSGKQKGKVYESIASNSQKKAVKFLINNAFNEQNWMIRPDITGKFIAEHSFNYTDISDYVNSHLNIVSRKQIRILSDLLSSVRLRGLEENSINVNDAYNIKELLMDLKEGLWGELNHKNIKINPYRQEIQIAYIAILKEIIKRENNVFLGYKVHSAYNKYFYSNYTRGVIIEELNNLKKEIERRLNKIKDESTRGHLKLCLLEIDK